MQNPKNNPTLIKALADLEKAKKNVEQALFAYFQEVVDTTFLMYPKIQKLSLSYYSHYEDNTMVEFLDVYFNDIEIDADDVTYDEVLEEVGNEDEAQQIVDASKYFEYNSDIRNFLHSDLYQYLDWDDNAQYGSGNLNTLEYVRK
jgi:hypothetical protein